MTSNKLDHLGEALGIGRKVEHEGIELWLECQAGDAGAWERCAPMPTRTWCSCVNYSTGCSPWLSNLNLGLFDDSGPVCTNCGSDRMEPAGHSRTKVSSYPSFRCVRCGKVSRSRPHDPNVQRPALP